jgi:hypothetical protein
LPFIQLQTAIGLWKSQLTGREMSGTPRPVMPPQAA